MGAADNTKPVPEAQDQQKAGTQSSSFESTKTAATKSFLEEIQGDSTPGTSKPNENNGATKVNDGTDSVTPGTDTGVESLRQESTGADAVHALAKMRAAGVSSEAMQKFGSPELFDSTDGVDALVNDAKAEDVKTKAEKTEPGDSGDESAIGTALTDLGNWAADTFNKYVAEPVSEAMSDISTAFDDAVQWFGESGTFKPVSGPIADINNGTDEYRAAQNQAARSNRFDLNGASDRSGEGLRMPENAVEAGTVEIGGNKVSVMKTPEGDTFLKNGDKVIGHQKADGSYELALKDGSNLDFKLSEGADGKYKLDNLERTKDGKLQQKIADGVFYNYNYDAQGKRTSVDAAGDLKGPLSPERLEAIKKELGDSGAAALRVTGEDGKTQRLLMQAHDKDTSSLTDIDAKRAQIFHDGKEYRLNEKDQLGLVDSNGDWQAPDAQDKKPASENPEAHPESQDETAEQKSRREEVERLRQEQLKQLEDLARRLGRRAQGDSDEAIDGVKIHTDPSGEATVTREDPSTGETLTTTEIPPEADKPITVINSAGEKTEIRGDNFDVTTRDGERLFDFNTETGLRTDNMLVDRDGMTDLDSGARVDTDGNLYDANGDFVSGDDQFFGEDCEDCHEIKEATDTSRSTSAQLIKLGSTITVAISQGDSQAALRYGMAALALGSSAMSAVGNDLIAQIPISHAMNQVRTLVAQAGSQASNQNNSTPVFNPLTPLDAQQTGRDRFRVVA